MHASTQALHNEAGAKPSGSISFDDSWGLIREKAFSRYFLQTTPVNLYAVTRENEKVPTQFKGQPVGFEMTLA